MKKLFMTMLLAGLMLQACGGGEASEGATKEGEAKSDKPAEIEFSADYVKKLDGYAIEGFTWKGKEMEMKEKTFNIRGEYEKNDTGDDTQADKIMMRVYKASGGKYSKIMTTLEEFAKDQMQHDDKNAHDTILEIAGYKVFRRLETEKEPGKKQSASISAAVFHDGVGFDYTLFAFNYKTKEEAVAALNATLVKTIESQPKP